MPGSKAEIRSKALSIRCYNLRKEGVSSKLNHIVKNCCYC